MFARWQTGISTERIWQSAAFWKLAAETRGKSCTRRFLEATATFKQFLFLRKFQPRSIECFFPFLLWTVIIHILVNIVPNYEHNLLCKVSKTTGKSNAELAVNTMNFFFPVGISHGSWKESVLSATGRLGLCSVSSTCACGRSHCCTELCFLPWRSSCTPSHQRRGTVGAALNRNMQTHIPFLYWEQKAVSILLMGTVKTSSPDLTPFNQRPMWAERCVER